MIRPLAEGFHVEVDGADDRGWYDVVSSFADANIYQLWQRRAEASRTQTSRLLVKKSGDLVAASEVRLFQLPLTSCGIAYVRWGPLWQTTAAAADVDYFTQVVRALRNEYVYRRRMVLRMHLRLFATDDQRCLQVLQDEGFATLPEVRAERTLLLNVTPPLDELRSGFPSRWRNHLKNAEKAGLTILSGTDLALFDDFTNVYREMLARKGLEPTADIQKHRRLQETLPDLLKMEVVLARSEGTPCAGAVVSALGDTALYLFGATNDVGLRSAASYIVQWEVLKLLKARSIRVYDLHGVNPESNPGTYHFKKGLAGKTGREVTFAGHVQCFEPSLANRSLLMIEQWRRRRRAARAAAAGAAVSASPVRAS